MVITTHSDITLAEVGADCLRVVQTVKPGRQTTLTKPLSPEPIQSLLRFTPRALFARRILVTEGNTELGILLGIRENWPARHAGRPIEQLGVAIADGNGQQACAIALALDSLGYLVAIFRDSDKTLSVTNQTQLATASIMVIEYGDGLNTEQAIFSAASDDLVQELLDFARAERGVDAIDNNLDIKIPDLTLPVIRSPFTNWDLFGALDGQQLRQAIAEVADRKRWFKDQRIGRGLAPAVWRIATQAAVSPLAQALARIEGWLYA